MACELERLVVSFVLLCLVVRVFRRVVRMIRGALCSAAGSKGPARVKVGRGRAGSGRGLHQRHQNTPQVHMHNENFVLCHFDENPNYSDPFD